MQIGSRTLKYFPLSNLSLLFQSYLSPFNKKSRIRKQESHLPSYPARNFKMLLTLRWFFYCNKFRFACQCFLSLQNCTPSPFFADFSPLLFTESLSFGSLYLKGSSYELPLFRSDQARSKLLTKLSKSRSPIRIFASVNVTTVSGLVVLFFLIPTPTSFAPEIVSTVPEAI